MVKSSETTWLFITVDNFAVAGGDRSFAFDGSAPFAAKFETNSLVAGT